jgi:hypothetical protein
MSPHASRTSVAAVDSAADAVGTAIESVKHGASEIQARVADAVPATRHFLGRAIYNTSYALAFGVTFPVMMIVRIVPRDNALVHGMVDGARAARDQVHGWGAAIEPELQESENNIDHASGNGSPGHDNSLNPANHRRGRPKRSATRKTGRPASRKKS